MYRINTSYILKVLSSYHLSSKVASRIQRLLLHHATWYVSNERDVLICKKTIVQCGARITSCYILSYCACRSNCVLQRVENLFVYINRFSLYLQLELNWKGNDFSEQKFQGFQIFRLT